MSMINRFGCSDHQVTQQQLAQLQQRQQFQRLQILQDSQKQQLQQQLQQQQQQTNFQQQATLANNVQNQVSCIFIHSGINRKLFLSSGIFIISLGFRFRLLRKVRPSVKLR